MGRIQRKKTSVKKKKRVAEAGADSSRSDVDISGKQKTARNGTATEISHKRQVVGRKKSVPSNKGPVAPHKGKENVFTKSIQFLREVKAELKKVTWPSRKQTIGSTIVVIVLVIIISFFLGAVDIALSSLIRLVLQ